MTATGVDPTFLLIGAQKSGTSWLHEMLRQHPDVCTPTRAKELHFFNIRNNFARGMDWYRAQFAGYGGERAIGESTPNYLWVTDAPASVQAKRQARGQAPIVFHTYPQLIRNVHEVVHRKLPGVKLVVSLRNPVHRAISSYFHAIRNRKISPRSRIMDVGGEQGILGMGFYYRQLGLWREVFPEDRFLVLIYEEDVAHHKARTLRRVFDHIGVDEDFSPPNRETRYGTRSSHPYMYTHYYAGGVARRLFDRAQWLHDLPRPRISVTDDDIRQLHELYATENRRLEELLVRSLEVWQPPSGDDRAA